MARPKSAQKLLEEALAKGDLEAAKVALAKTKEKPKKKTVKPKKSKNLEPDYETDNSGAVLLVKDNRKKPADVNAFRVKRQDSYEDGNDDYRQSTPQRLQVGVFKNKFVPDPKEATDLIEEDKKAMKKANLKYKEYREKVDISQVQTTCDGCDRLFTMEKWELEAKQSVSELDILCTKCLKARK